MDLRTRACFALSRRWMPVPVPRTVDYGVYTDWRNNSLSSSWRNFSDAHITGKEVLDFGCGDGQLSFFLAHHKHPRRIVGVDLNAAAIDRCNARLRDAAVPEGVYAEFVRGAVDGMPLPDAGFDTLLAFDCLEHVMSPGQILREWHRVLKPGGRCLIEWFPYKGPWGPHMEALVPIPWAPVLFGERAMFRTAEMVYDLPEFMPRHWDLDEQGNKKPNKWRAWSSFAEQGYINKLDLKTFKDLARAAGFELARLDLKSFGGSALQQAVGRALMRMPVIGEYFVSYSVIELVRRN